MNAPTRPPTSSFAARWRLALRLALRGLAASRNRTASAIVALGIGVAAIAIRPAAVSLHRALLVSGLVFIIATALALQSSPVEQQRRNERLLVLLGASSVARRRVHLAEQLLVSLVATILGLIVGALLAFVRGDQLSVLTAVMGGVVLPALLAWLEIAQGFPARPGLPRTTLALSPVKQGGYTLAGLTLIGFGTVLPAGSTTYNDLGWTLWPGLLLVATGLSLLTSVVRPYLVGLVAGRAPFPGVRLAARFSRRTWAGEAAAVRVTAMATVIVVALSILGAGFTAREDRRRAAFPVHQITVGLHDNEVVVTDPTAFPGITANGARLDVAALRKRLPNALVDTLTTPTRPLGGDPESTGGPSVPALEVVTPPGRTRLSQGTMAIATPEVLQALGLQRFTSDLDDGRALALDPQMVDAAGTIALTPSRLASDATSRPVHVPAIVVSPDRAASRLPSVLISSRSLTELPAGMDLGQTATLGIVVSLPGPATEREVAIVRAATGPDADVAAGGTVDHERLDATRLDAADSVLRQRSDRSAAIFSMSALVLAAALLALRFATLANRSDDEVLALLGARRTTRRAVEAWRAGLMTATGVALGLTTGVAASAAGLAIYNHHSRFTQATPLPPIPFQLPAELAILGALPVAAALLALAATAGKHLGTRPPQRLVVRDT